jgi:hypothetical protein
MSRTLGAKDKKPRKIVLKKIAPRSVEDEMLASIGIEAKKPRKPRKPRQPKINWEVLAKQLQQALASEIKENDQLRENNTQLITQSIKLLGAIEYLENKRGNN